MITIPVKTRERLISGVKKFNPILVKARDKDINESDTVTIIVDILKDIFGYDKFNDITSELAIKKTFCDLAIKIDGQTRLLIEVKSAGMDLKEEQIRQATNYGSNSGIDWVVLTNGIIWKVYKIVFAKPIDTELLYEIDLLNINTKRQTDLELLYYLTLEAMGKASKGSLENYLTQKQLLNRFIIGQILVCDTSLDMIRKTIRKMSPDANITNEEVKQVLIDEVIKREVFDGEKAVEAKKKINKAFKSVAKPPQKKIEN